MSFSVYWKACLILNDFKIIHNNCLQQEGKWYKNDLEVHDFCNNQNFPAFLCKAQEI